MAKNEDMIFPKGQKNEALAQYFEGQFYLNPLIQAEGDKVGVSNVTFEPGSRNHWHIHRNGYQILQVTEGKGWYQEEGKPAQALKAGDVVEVEEGVKHWHGAVQDDWFTHLSISNGEIEWLEAVTDDWYNNL